MHDVRGVKAFLLSKVVLNNLYGHKSNVILKPGMFDITALAPAHTIRKVVAVALGDLCGMFNYTVLASAFTIVQQ